MNPQFAAYRLLLFVTHSFIDGNILLWPHPPGSDRSLNFSSSTSTNKIIKWTKSEPNNEKIILKNENLNNRE